MPCKPVFSLRPHQGDFCNSPGMPKPSWGILYFTRNPSTGNGLGDVPVPRWPCPQLHVPLLPLTHGCRCQGSVDRVGGVSEWGVPWNSPCGLWGGENRRVCGQVGTWVYGPLESPWPSHLVESNGGIVGDWLRERGHMDPLQMDVQALCR